MHGSNGDEDDIAAIHSPIERQDYLLLRSNQFRKQHVVLLQVIKRLAVYKSHSAYTIRREVARDISSEKQLSNIACVGTERVLARASITPPHSFNRIDLATCT